MKEYDNLQALMDDRPSNSQPHVEQLMDSTSIQAFLSNMREHGMTEDAQNMEELFSLLDKSGPQIQAMREQIRSLQAEVEQLSGGTPLTDQFKTEMQTRSLNMWKRLDDLSSRLIDVKNTIFDAVRTALHNLAEKGKMALHLACADILESGMDYLNESMEIDQHAKKDSLETIQKLNAYQAAKQTAHQQRSDLMRSLFNLQNKPSKDPKESMVLNAIRKTAQLNVSMDDRSIQLKKTLLSKLEAQLDRHLAAIERKPSMDEMLQNAKKRADQQQRNNINDRNRNRGGPSLQ